MEGRWTEFADARSSAANVPGVAAIAVALIHGVP